MRHTLRTYSLTLAALAAALLLRHLLDPLLGNLLPLATVFFTIPIALYLGGWRPALFATLLGYLAGTFLFVDPRYTLHLGFPQNPNGLIAYLPGALLVILFGEAIRNARRRAHAAELDILRQTDTLRASEQQLRLLADALPALVAYLDNDLRYQFNNRAYCDWLGHPIDSFKGRTVRDVLGDALYQTRLPHLQHALQGRLVRFESTTRHHERGDVPCETHYVPDFAPDGSVRGLVVLIQDITARKLAEAERERLLISERAAREQAERASDAKSQFLATLSHELRTPLTPVLLSVSMLESRPDLPPDLRAEIASIRQNVELESRLIGDLLDLTRISSGKLQLSLEPLDVHPLLRAAIHICQRNAAANLHLHLAATHTTLQGDPTRLQQIFWNLITNAMKFTPPGGQISIATSDTPTGIRIDIADSGEGIDPAVLPKLFNAFEQGDARVHRQQAGLGLGLAISRKLAEAHQGTITAHSVGRGQGATFTVLLPATAAPLRTSSPTPTTPPPATSPLHILLVEDHEPTRKTLTRVLESLGHRVASAPTLSTGLAAARATDFHLLISDLGLPDGSGLDLIRQLLPSYHGRAIALTGYGMESDIAASRAAGFAEHLTKPIDLPQLTATLSRLAQL